MNKKTVLKLKKLIGYDSGLIEKARFRKLVDIYNKLPAKSRPIFVENLENAGIRNMLSDAAALKNSQKIEENLEKTLDEDPKDSQTSLQD